MNFRTFLSSVLVVWMANLAAGVRADDAVPAAGGNPDRYNIVWDSPSKDSRGSMPIGNGDIALNVWTETDGDLLFYIAKSDAVSENSQLLKLGRVRVKFTPNPFAKNLPFKQELRLSHGDIAIAAGKDAPIEIRLWVDANRPVIELEASGPKPFEMQANLEVWRTEPRTLDAKSKEIANRFEYHNGNVPVVFDPDTVLPARENQVVWYHRDEHSIYPDVLKNQHLSSLLEKYPDPLEHRTFGGCMKGPGLIAAGDRAIRSAAPATNQRLSISLLTAQTETAEQWAAKLAKLTAAADAVDRSSARKAHDQWWSDFWNRSWIHLTGPKEAQANAQSYAMQRFMIACCGRGNLPIKFNGALFNVDETYAGTQQNADFRAWGSNYWFQNTRHLYWPLVMNGDWDMLAPWFKMYLDALPLATAKTRLYFHHGGACFQETMFFWGTPNNGDFGWNNPSTEVTNGYVRWYWSGGLELTAMMLDQYDCTQDRHFASETLLPLADAITIFYDEHWKRDANGKIRFEPVQSLETWQKAVNPLPDIAGLRFILPRLIALPEDLTTAAQRATWRKTLADLPPIPIGRAPDLKVDKRVLLPAEKYANKSNSENTEEYAIFPYRLYGLGMPDLDLAIDTFRTRRFHGGVCWAWDVIVAACLGLTDDAQKLVTVKFVDYGGQRFKWFWSAGSDWIPDMDNGGSGSTALQRMLMQCNGRRILLLPAWPADWDADFKLHAPYQTVVEAKVRHGQVVELHVTPAERNADVVIAGPN
jgi:alpha-L-fucosidase 2